MEDKLKDRPLESLKRPLEKANWYVFYVTAKHEKKAEKLLLRDGFEPYLPLVKVLKYWKQRKKWIEEPLFKSYIFVKVKKNQIYDVLQTPSIITYIKFAGEPAEISQQHIDLIKDLIINKTKFELSTDTVKVGESIKLKAGPFKGQKGVVKEIRGKRRLLVSLESINFTLEIEL